MKRSCQLPLQKRVNPVLIALLLAWSAEGAFANPSPSPTADQHSDGVSPYLVLGAMAVGFAATYALLLGGSDRSYSRSSPATTGGGAADVPPQQPGDPGENETPGGTETGGAIIDGDPPASGNEGPGVAAPTANPARTAEAPEPGTLFLLGSGAAALFAARLRRRPR